MSDSLLFGGYELLGDQVNPEYRLLRDSDLSAPEPDTATIAGVLLSGDRVTGHRSGNRQPVLPIRVTGTDRLDVGEKVNRLLTILDCQPPNESFPLVWTPDGGLPVTFDCYRGVFKRLRDLVRERQFATLLELKMSATPFGRSDIPETIAAASPQLAVDSMDTAPTGATLDTTHHYEGTGSAAFTMTRSGPTSLRWAYASAAATRPITAADLSSFATLGVRLRWPAPGSGGQWVITGALTLSDGTHTATQWASIIIPAGSTAWQLVRWRLYTGGVASSASAFGDVDLTAVTSWSLTWTTVPRFFLGTPPATSTANIDDLRAFPSSSTSVSTPLGALVTIPDVKGTAPAPAALQVTRSGSVMTALAIHSPPLEQSLDAQILTELTGGTTATIPPAGNKFAGTYVVVLMVDTPGSDSRSVTVTVTQKDGATTVATETILPVTYGALIGPAGPFVVVGEVTLPLVPVPAENVSHSMQFDVSTTGTTPDTFSELALMNTRGQLILLGELPSGTTTVYVDLPDPIAELGQVYASPTDRTAAVGVLGWGAKSRVDGGPVSVEPGDNQLLVWCPDGEPDVAAAYDPHWLDERTA